MNMDPWGALGTVWGQGGLYFTILLKVTVMLCYAMLCYAMFKYLTILSNIFKYDQISAKYYQILEHSIA